MLDALNTHKFSTLFSYIRAKKRVQQANPFCISAQVVSCCFYEMLKQCQGSSWSIKTKFVWQLVVWAFISFYQRAPWLFTCFNHQTSTFHIFLPELPQQGTEIVLWWDPREFPESATFQSATNRNIPLCRSRNLLGDKFRKNRRKCASTWAPSWAATAPSTATTTRQRQVLKQRPLYTRTGFQYIIPPFLMCLATKRIFFLHFTKDSTLTLLRNSLFSINKLNIFFFVIKST